MFQAGTAKFDRKTEAFQMFQLPPHLLKPDSQTALVGPQNWTVDNRIWLQDPSRRGIYRMNVATGDTELFEPFAPYDVAHDKLGNIWTGGMNADRILRISTESGEVTEYPLPRPTNIRRVFVDNTTSPPTFWVGSNHGASTIKLEPLD